MRINIVIDDKLLDEAIRVTGTRTRREVVELRLKALTQIKSQEDIRSFRGKLRWRDDLDLMRAD